MSHPEIIQGGMGAGVSNWRLARAVARTGQLGVVSGTALGPILVRRLQTGDPGGEMRRAMARFPVPGVAARALADYYVPGGKAANEPFKLTSFPGLNLASELTALTVLAPSASRSAPMICSSLNLLFFMSAPFLEAELQLCHVHFSGVRPPFQAYARRKFHPHK